MAEAGFVRLFVSYCQYQVGSGPARDSLQIFLAGDELVHAGGPSGCTGFTGVHTGHVEMRVVVHAGEPPVDDAWDAASETTLWCPEGRITVAGLMGDRRDELSDVPVPQADQNLVRVRVYARDRIHESVRTSGDPPERHEIHVWPVAVAEGHRTLYSDGSHTWSPRPDQAAAWALETLVGSPERRSADAREAALRAHRAAPQQADPRVTVVRRQRRVTPFRPAGTIPAGDLEIRLTRAGDGTLAWRWAPAAQPLFPQPGTALPDEHPSTVTITERTDIDHADAGPADPEHADAGPADVAHADAGRADEGWDVVVRHTGVLASQAVAVGMIWDHLLSLADVSKPAWQEDLRARAAEAHRLAEERKRRDAALLAADWGGAPPSERQRGLGSQGRKLARLDRPLLDRLTELPPERQRAVAHWAARRTLELCGLDRVDWIAEDLAAAEAGYPVSYRAESYPRLLSDPQVPQTAVRIPGFQEPVLIQAMAFGVMPPLAGADPLAAAVQVIDVAILAHGYDAARFLADCRAEVMP